MADTNSSKCSRDTCKYMRHPNKTNNGGLYCCLACKISGKHGNACKGASSDTSVILNAKSDTTEKSDTNYFLVVPPNEVSLYGFLLETINNSFSDVPCDIKDGVYRFENEQTAIAGLSTLAGSAYGGISGSGTTSDYCAPAGEKLLDMKNEIRIAYGNKAPVLVLRRLQVENKESPANGKAFFFVIQNLGGALLPGVSSHKFSVGLTIL